MRWFQTGSQTSGVMARSGTWASLGEAHNSALISTDFAPRAARRSVVVELGYELAQDLLGVDKVWFEEDAI